MANIFPRTREPLVAHCCVENNPLTSFQCFRVVHHRARHYRSPRVTSPLRLAVSRLQMNPCLLRIDPHNNNKHCYFTGVSYIFSALIVTSSASPGNRCLPSRYVSKHTIFYRCFLHLFSAYRSISSFPRYRLRPNISGASARVPGYQYLEAIPALPSCSVLLALVTKIFISTIPSQPVILRRNMLIVPARRYYT
ncbi:hypothetical protein IW262DRAFT_506902 [Armillaria fumosa]|nr:hypothetical protein IW262DRAFT_506902 [Armillaria fumosa]